jgi:hypothetical protein
MKYIKKEMNEVKGEWNCRKGQRKKERKKKRKNKVFIDFGETYSYSKIVQMDKVSYYSF